MGNTNSFACAFCGNASHRTVGEINRAAKRNAPLFCSKTCSGLARRIYKTTEQKKLEKKEYDRHRRRGKLREEILRKKREAYHAKLATNPEAVRAAERRNREARKQDHLEYCRRPEYRKYKKEYDRRYRADRFYGPFAEAFLVLQDIDDELNSRSSKYERYAENGTLNKTQRRKRSYEQSTNSR